MTQGEDRLGRDHRAKGIFRPNTQPDKEAPEHDPPKDAHGLVVISSRALRQAKCAKYYHDQLQAVKFPPPITVCQVSKDQLAQQRACQGDSVDCSFMVAGFVSRPVHEDQRGEDHVGREEVVGIREEARAGDSPDLPVEAIGIDVATDLATLIDI